MRELLAIVASGAWLFLSGIVIYVILLNDWNNAHFGHISRDTKDFPIWAAIAEKLLQGLALTLLVVWTTIPLLSLSVLPVLLVWAGYLSTYADYKVSGKPVLILTLIDSARIFGALILAGILLGHHLV